MATLAVSLADDAPEREAPIPALLPIYGRAPFELVRGEGVHLIDSTGKRYLDFASGIAVNALGYGDPGLKRAIAEALEAGLIHVSNLYRTGAGERLAASLVEKSFASSVFFCNSGAEANEGAFKFARKWARRIGGKEKHAIVSLRGSFHGRLFATLAATDRPQYRTSFTPLLPAVSIAERDLDQLDDLLSSAATAALIVEPVQGEGGVRVLDAGFLRELRAMTAERRIALIFDEIQCGLGRTGRLFGYELSGVVPDLLTLAKPLAGGLPMGAILMNAEIAAALRPGDHATTFGGGPLVAAAAEHVLARISDEKMLRSVQTNGVMIGQRLEKLATRSARVRGARGVGHIWGLDVTEKASDVVKRGWDAGILLLTAGDHTLRILPPLVMSGDDIAYGLDILESLVS